MMINIIWSIKMGGDTDAEQARGAIQQGLQQQKAQEQQAEQAWGPYSGLGGYAIPKYEGALEQGADPSGYLNQLMGQYQESPYLQNQLQFGQQAAGRAAAQSGMLGSGAEMQAAAGRAQGLRAEDMQNYLNRALGLRQQYLGGMGGLMGMGEEAASGIAGERTGLGKDIGKAYTGIGQTYMSEAQKPGIGGQLLGLAGTLGGAFLGGPGGAAVGGGIGKYFGGGQSQSQYGLPLPFQD